jgi:hypothetical protein
MTKRKTTLLAVLLTAAAVAAMIAFGGKESSTAQAKEEPVPGQPSVEIISPRNGARQDAHAVVVKVAVENFQLAPRQFGHQPEFGEGHIRFSLNRVPDCVSPAKLEAALNSPLGKERLKGRSFDYPEFAGPNGQLAEQIGTAGSYSPATRPEIYYHRLPPGFYRMIVTLAQNNGTATPAHDVTNFQILRRQHDKKLQPCTQGKVSSAAAAAQLE